MTDERQTITFEYLNHNGKQSTRTVTVDAVEFFNKITLGYQPGWYISGFCHDKQARRSFALSRILFTDELFDRNIYKLLTL